jgi:hypothetical protein
MRAVAALSLTMTGLKKYKNGNIAAFPFIIIICNKLNLNACGCRAIARNDILETKKSVCHFLAHTLQCKSEYIPTPHQIMN